jgi:hypothetical protein
MKQDIRALGLQHTERIEQKEHHRYSKQTMKQHTVDLHVEIAVKKFFTTLPINLCVTAIAMEVAPPSTTEILLRTIMLPR